MHQPERSRRRAVREKSLRQPAQRIFFAVVVSAFPAREGFRERRLVSHQAREADHDQWSVNEH